MDEVIPFYNTLISSEYEDTIARNLTTLMAALSQGISTLMQTPGADKMVVSIGVGDGSGLDIVPPLQHDDIILPHWKRFAAALSSFTLSRKLTSVCFGRIRLSKAVMDMLLQSLKTAPVDRLYFYYNGLGKDGYTWLIEVLNSNTSLKTLSIESNPIESYVVATKFINALIGHPNVDTLSLNGCRLGQNNGVVVNAILPALLQHLTVVSLNDNDIGSYGATLISGYLAKNPLIQKLLLDDNLLNDADAKKLSECLKTNNNLRVLDVSLNTITREGKAYLLFSVFNPTSLNSLSDSNHTCFIKLTEEEDVFGLRSFNTFIDHEINKNVKLASPLQYGTKYLQIDTPLQIMPRVIALLGTTIQLTPKYKLDGLFKFMSEWSMPLLYTSRLGKEPRRSKRIREKMVMKYMGKK